MKLTIIPDHIAPNSFWQIYLGDYTPESIPPVCRVHASQELDDLITEVLDREGMLEIDLNAMLIASLNERKSERENERKSERVSPEKVSEPIVTVDIETTGVYTSPETLKSGDFDWTKSLFGEARFSPMNWMHWGEWVSGEVRRTDFPEPVKLRSRMPLAPVKDKNFRWRLRKGRVVG